MYTYMFMYIMYVYECIHDETKARPPDSLPPPAPSLSEIISPPPSPLLLLPICPSPLSTPLQRSHSSTASAPASSWATVSALV